MTHDNAREEIDEIYEQTLELVGAGWSPPSSAEWRGCAILESAKDNETWARFTQRFGLLDEPPTRIAEKVADLWTRLGYPTKVVSDDRMTPPREVVSYPPYLTGTTTDGFGIVFTVGEGYADFTGNSRCVPMDPDLDWYPS